MKSGFRKLFMAKKYFAGCDVGSTYTKAVILDEQGNIVAHTTIRSKINSEQSAQIAMHPLGLIGAAFGILKFCA